MADPADDLIGPPDDAMLSQPDAGERQTQRFAKQRSHSILDAAPDIGSEDEYAALEPGKRYRGPDKQIRQKAYEVKSQEDYDLVPEGSHYLDPQGQKRQKPAAEGVGYSADTLHQMARTPETRRQALEKFYPGQVKQDTRGEFYVETEDGKILRPGHGVSGFAGNLTAEAAPAIGMVGGGALGGAADVETGVIPGAAAGAMLGAAAGRQLNNVVLGLAGIHETLPEQIKSVVGEAAGVGAGELLGRGLTKIPAALAKTKAQTAGVRDSLGGLRENLPQVLEQLGITPERTRRVLGTTQDAAERASNITKEQVHIPGMPEDETTNVRVPPSVYAPEAPYLKKIEEFDRVFRSQDVVQQSWEAFYNKQAEEILADKAVGVSMEELATRATKKVSSEHAGMLALSAAQKDMAIADGELENARRDLIAGARRPIDQAGGEKAVGELRQQAMDRLTAAYDRAQAAAQNTIQIAAKNLRGEIELSIRAAAAGEDTSDLNRVIAASFQAHNIGLRARARLMYDAAGDAAGGARLDTAGLAEEADAFLKSMPEQVRQKYPVEIANLAKIAKAMEAEAGGEGGFKTESFDVMGEVGGPKQEPADTTMTFGDLHQLRSWFRYGIDYNDMTPDMKAGSLKFFEKKINSLLHEGQTPELKEASGLLDKADDFYKKNIPFLSDQMVQGTIDMLKSGEGANPEALAKMFFDPERTSAMRRVRGIVGENLWKGVQAADVRHMLDESRLLGSAEIDGAKFAQQVESRLKNGILETAYDSKTAARLQKIATDIKTLKGELPITSDPGDTISTLMNRASLAKAEADKFAEMDPLKALNQEMSRIDKEFNEKARFAKAARRQEPLGFLNEKSMSHLAVKAADKILGSQDLIMEAATKFGRDSPEFNSLRQVYVARWFQRAFPKTAAMRAELGSEKGMTEEVQALMFPGVTRDQMLTLAKNMEFLFSAGGTDVGGSLAAASRVLHPEANFPLQMKGLKVLMGLPGAGTVARYTLGKYFALMMDATTHPNFINWLAGRLQGDAFARQEARAAIQQRIRMGALLGRVAGQQMLTPQQTNEAPEAVQ